MLPSDRWTKEKVISRIIGAGLCGLLQEAQKIKWKKPNQKRKTRMRKRKNEGKMDLEGFC